MLPDNYEDIVIYNGYFQLCRAGSVETKPFAYTVAQLEQELLQSPCSGQRLAKEEQAENTLMPPLVVLFYEFLFNYQTLPTDQELVEYYINHYFEKNPQNPSSVKLKAAYANGRSAPEVSVAGVTNRLLRMYPSLVRDLYFMLLCLESGCFSDVYYSVKQDYKQGYDLVVKRNNVKVYVRLMVETLRSGQYNNRKYNRHDLSRKNIFELKIRLVPERKLGQFYLYNKQDLHQLLAYIDSNASSSKA